MKTQITYDEGVREECIYEGNDSKSKNSKKKKTGQQCAMDAENGNCKRRTTDRNMPMRIESRNS